MQNLERSVTFSFDEATVELSVQHPFVNVIHLVDHFVLLDSVFVFFSNQSVQRCKQLLKNP